MTTIAVDPHAAESCRTTSADPRAGPAPAVLRRDGEGQQPALGEGVDGGAREAPGPVHLCGARRHHVLDDAGQRLLTGHVADGLDVGALEQERQQDARPEPGARNEAGPAGLRCRACRVDA
jgi:hypothetical protein